MRFLPLIALRSPRLGNPDVEFVDEDSALASFDGRVLPVLCMHVESHPASSRSTECHALGTSGMCLSYRSSKMDRQGSNTPWMHYDWADTRPSNRPLMQAVSG